MPGRRYLASNAYRFGFNGKEKNSEIEADNYDFGARIYESRTGNWLSVDPYANKYAGFSPYVFVLNSPNIFIDPDGKDVIVKRTPAEYTNFKGSISLPVRLKTVHDLGATGIDKDLGGGVTFVKKKNGYDVLATIVEIVNPKIKGDASVNKLIGQGSLQKEVEAHEDGHGDQLEEALKAKYTIDFPDIKLPNGKVSKLKFTGTLDQILEQADQKFDVLKQQGLTGKVTKQQFVDAAFERSKVKVAEKLNSYDREADANARAAVKLGGVKNMPYTNGVKPIILVN